MLRRIFSLKFLVWTLVLLTALVLAFIAEENWRGKRAWEKYREAAEKRGVKLFLKDFIQPDIPDEENYAAIPVIRTLFVTPKEGKERPSPFSFPIGESQPKAPDDIKARRFDTAGWQEFFLKTKLLAEKSDSAGRDILRALEKFEPELQQLRDASPRPKCKFPTHWEEGAATPLRHLSFGVNATRIFRLRAQAQLASGNSAAAFAELGYAFRLERAYRSELALISGLVRTACVGLIESTIWDGLAGRQWAVRELVVIEGQLARLKLAEDCRFVFATERGFGNAFCLNFAENGPDKMFEQMKPLEDLGMASFTRFDRIVFRMMPRGWSYQVMVRNNEFFDWLLASLDDSDQEGRIRFPKSIPSSRDWLGSHPAAPGIGKISKMISEQSLPAFDAGCRRYFYAHTRTEETRLACALERFRHAKGEFPERIEALVPAFMEAVPDDVFDRKPLRYRRNDDGGYDLWSIGPDGKDDGGKIDPTKDDQSQDDWIWHMPGPAKAP